MKIPLIVVFMALLSVAASERKPPENVAELFVTAENLEMIRYPEKVDACVLRYIAPPKGHNIREERYEETEYVVISKELAAPMQGALLRNSNYGWEYAKGCEPRFHTRLRFHQKDKTVAIDFCFDCEILRIYQDGVLISGEDFKDRIFLATMRQLFPNDLALKKTG